MISSKIIILAALSICFSLKSYALSAQSAKDIIVQFDEQNRKSYNTEAVKIKLSTCKYTVAQGSMRCTDDARNVIYENILKRCGDNNRDTRAVAVVLEPISDKGIGMLNYLYDDPSKDNDNWLYLSALGKVKRIVSSGDDNDESGSLFGSEFSVDESESIETRKIDEYTYKIIGEEAYDQKLAWVIETVPTSEKTKKSRYSKFVSWIDKERYVLLKENLYDRNGKLYKQRSMRNIVKIDNVWIAKKVTMNNLSTRRATNMELISVAFNMDVSDEFLTQRTLTDFAFREKTLAKIRAKLK